MIKTIELSDKPAIEALRNRYNHTYASHAFNMLYAWKDLVGNRLFIEDDIFSLNYTAKGENAWMFPVGSDSAKKAFIEKNMNSKDFLLCYMRDEDADFLDQYFPDKFFFETMPEDSEYVYNVANHISLAGNIYRTFRYHVNSATRRFPNLRIKELSEETKADALAVINGWKPRGKDRGSLHIEGNEAEILPCKMWKELGYYGIIIYADDEPLGTALGYQLSDDICDFAIRKLCVDDRDLGYYIAWLFTKQAAKRNNTLINYEDDMNIVGLREFKQGLHPDIMNTVTEAYLL